MTRPHAARGAPRVGILTVTEAARREIIEYLDLSPERVHVVPAAPADLYRPVDDPDEIAAVRARHRLERPYLLFVGTLEPRKNLPRLLQAFARLKRELGLPHELAIVGGRGWKFDPIFATVQATGVAESVRFLDYVALADMPALYAGAELLVFPSLYEGFGVPPLEAMRVGTPVVTSDVPALREVAGDAAIQVDPFDVASIAEGMRAGLTDESRRASLKARGLLRGDLFTWDRSAEAAIEVYRSVLGRQGALRGPIPAPREGGGARAERAPLTRSQSAALYRIARLPYVRLVAVSDSTVSAEGSEALLVVAARGRRACVHAGIGLVTGRRGPRVQWLLDAARLKWEPRGEEGARRLAGLRPVEASTLYDILLDRNLWSRRASCDLSGARSPLRLWPLKRGQAWQRCLELLLAPLAPSSQSRSSAGAPYEEGRPGSNGES
ncbi:MAG: glycosyltransferase family 1 protein [Candidatus Eisenbacteria bacterium]